MAKTYQQIQDEADRLFGKGPSNKKFDWRREQQRAAGLKTEGKKRGGVAGVYDRNKKLVSAAATAAGYYFLGPGGAAAARGAVQGFDRPGKSGIGFDVGRGAKGALEGYAAGTGAEFLQAGAAKVAPKLKSLFGAKAAPATSITAPMIDTPIPDSIAKMQGNLFAPQTAAGAAGGGLPTFTPSAAGSALSSQIAGMAGGMGAGAAGGGAGAGGSLGNVANAKTPKGSSAMQSILGFAKENPAIVANAATAGANVIGSKIEADTANRRYDLEEEMFRQEQARRERLAKLLMPFFQQQLQQYNSQAQG